MEYTYGSVVLLMKKYVILINLAVQSLIQTEIKYNN
jgi:hypothetical protein